MSKNCAKVPPSVTLRDAIESMHDNQQHCVLVVDAEGFLEGILTYGDIKRFLSRKSNDALDSDSSLHEVYHENSCDLLYQFRRLFLLFVHVFVCLFVCFVKVTKQ